MSRTVLVADNEQEVFTINKEGERILAGSLIREEYQGEDLYNYGFRPDGMDKTVKIGIMHRDTIVRDPYSVISPLLEAGWEIKKHYNIRATGKEYQFVLDNPSLPAIDDPIDWDASLWPGVGGSKLTESLVVDASLSPRRSINFNRGLYRLICTNGLVGEVMQFGMLHVSHSAFDPTSVVSQIRAFQNAGTDMKRRMGPVFGRPSDAGRLATFIRRNFLNPDDADGPGMVTVPNFLRDVVSTFESLPKWYLDRYSTQMSLMEQNLTRDVHGLDVLNAITNPISLELRLPEEDRNAIGRIISREKSILEATEKMVGVFSLIFSLN